MNIQKALFLFEIYDNPTFDKIKKQYKIKALKYHPDKNKSINASAKFQEISIAYQYLMTHFQEPVSFISPSFITPSFITPSSFLSLFYQLYLCIQKYREHQIHHKQPNKKYIRLYPRLNDILDNNLYKIMVEEKEYFIPLWHHELIYDDIIVQCSPLLPDNISIDENNNIVVQNIQIPLLLLFQQTFFLFLLGTQEIYIYAKDVSLISTSQIIVLFQQGIPQIQTTNVYDISIKSNIIAHITLIV